MTRRRANPSRFSQRLCLAALLALVSIGHMVAYAAMEVSLPYQFAGRGVARGVVQVRCATAATNTVRVSRGAVLDLDLGGSGRDVVLTTAHGLSDTREAIRRSCRVVGAEGRAYEIARIWRTHEARGGVEGDWAVLMLDSRLEGDVARLPVGRVNGETLSELARDGAMVRLQLREADQHRGDCRLRPMTPSFEMGSTELIVYSCLSSLGFEGVPGLSGSPLLIGIEGQPVVIGIHKGWGWSKLEDDRLHVVSLGRPIDEEIAAAIEAAGAEARLRSGARERQRRQPDQ